MSDQVKLLRHARTFLGQGIREVPGTKSHPQIAAWIARTEKENPTDLNRDDSRYSWCGVFVGCMCLDVGLPVPDLFQRAIKWAQWGDQVLLKDREPGDVMVWQTGANQFHVNIYVQDVITHKLFECLGGNQSNSLNLQNFKSDIFIACRRFYA